MLRDSIERVGRRALTAGLDVLPNRVKWEVMSYAPARYLNILPVESEEEFTQSGREEVETILERLDDYGADVSLPDSRVLEIGVGPGRLLVPMGERGAEVHGVDISRGNLAKARRYADDEGVSPSLQRASAGLPAYDTSFDLIYAVLVFQHMRRRTAIRYMRDARELLAADGVVYFTFANLADDDYRAYYVSEGLEKTYSFRMRYHTESEVRLLLTELGYGDVTVLDTGPQLVAMARR